MNLEQPTVFIVDDDEVDLERLSRLFGKSSIAFETFATPEEFLAAFDEHRPGCLLLDYRMPRMDGLEIQQELADRKCQLPIILMSGSANVDSCANAFRAGAFDFIEKSVEDAELLESVSKALKCDAHNRKQRASLSDLLGKLSARELEVMQHVLHGKTVKQISQHLNIAFATAAKHRSRILDKVGVDTDVELVNRLNLLGYENS